MIRQMGRPIRSKHCRSCDACVARMDHHCTAYFHCVLSELIQKTTGTWINNCVGAGNHTPFLFLLSLIIVMHGAFAYFCYLGTDTHHSLFPSISRHLKSSNAQ